MDATYKGVDREERGWEDGGGGWMG